jgi:molecular chaperone IbpA
MKQVHVTTFNLETLPKFAIGFDRMFEELARTQEKLNNSNYPPYNIVRLAETEYAIEVAVAGFEESELDVEVVNGELVIRGETTSNEVDHREGNYIHHGIAARNFTRTFALPDNSEVSGATVRNGILTVNVVVHIPESSKKKIAITFQK